MSAFIPVNPTLYYVFHSYDFTDNFVAATPSPSFFSEKEKSPRPVRVVATKQRSGKKYWSPEQKKQAIKKAKLFGLSKATRFLQNEFPSTFGDLSPSTLQYWVQKDKESILC
ncbi:Homeobox domain-containing protein [Entamoeba marina]